MSLLADLARALPGLPVSASAVDRVSYARDLWPRHHLAVSAGRDFEHRPAAIAWPRSTEEVASLVRYCRAEGVPLVPFGAGSGVCGGILPEARAVVCDLKRMRRTRTLDTEEPSIDVEAGALGITLEEDLNARGFTLGHFPSSILCSTVGGWIATRSAGQCSGLYGKIEDMVAGLELVTGEGAIVNLSRRTHGPDLTPLVIGSEGVLGVVTSARLRLQTAPKHRAFAAYTLPNLEAGCDALRDLFQAGLRPAVSRLYDPFDTFIARRGAVRGKRERHGPRAPGTSGLLLRSILRAPKALNALIDALGARVLGGALLVLVFEGEERNNADDARRANELALSHGAEPLGEAPAKHWFSHRYSVSYRQAPIFMAGAFSDTMEVAASWANLGALHAAVRKAISKHAFVMAHLSHAYPDGCSIYFTFVGSAPTPAEAEAKYDAAWRAALDAAIDAGGTLSHHHGVGRSKAPKLGRELGAGVDVLHALRNALDPAGILNPGNLVPRERAERRPIALPPSSPIVDSASRLVHAAGKATLAEVQTALSKNGLALDLGPEAPSLDTTVDAWIARGAPGAPDPWADPVAHLVAGFSARLRSGTDVEVRPAPRRAVGPDLLALFHGMEGRVGTIESAHLTAHDPRQPKARAQSTQIARNPAISAQESALVDRVVEAAQSVR